MRGYFEVSNTNFIFFVCYYSLSYLTSKSYYYDISKLFCCAFIFQIELQSDGLVSLKSYKKLRKNSNNIRISKIYQSNKIMTTSKKGSKIPRIP